MSLNNLKTRLQFLGGAKQQDRMITGKLVSLKKAMQSSYQAATIILPNGQEFKCLINPDKLNLDADTKILSIPFQDVCLNEQSQEEQQIQIKEGIVIQWKENKSHWLVYLQHLEEVAYFRASLRRCRHQITLANGTVLYAYVRGPVESNASWSQSGGNYINQLNYTLQILVTKNQETEEFCSRFQKVLVDGKPWEIQATDKFSTPGVIELFLKEDYTQNYEETSKIEQTEESSLIKGPTIVTPYKEYTYTCAIVDAWNIVSMSRPNAVKVISEGSGSIRILIQTGKSGNFELQGIDQNGEIVDSKKIQIESV